MERFVKSQGFYVIEKFVGHGIGQTMHEDPQVPNFVSKALRKHDIRLEPGIVLAIEPMVALGTKEVRTFDDGWTVETKDRRPSAHFEHTVAMTPEGPRVLTYLEDADGITGESGSSAGLKSHEQFGWCGRISPRERDGTDSTPGTDHRDDHTNTTEDLDPAPIQDSAAPPDHRRRIRADHRVGSAGRLQPGRARRRVHGG